MPVRVVPQVLPRVELPQVPVLPRVPARVVLQELQELQVRAVPQVVLPRVPARVVLRVPVRLLLPLQSR